MDQDGVIIMRIKVHFLGECRPVVKAPPPLIGILIFGALEGEGLINHGSTLRGGP